MIHNPLWDIAASWRDGNIGGPASCYANDAKSDANSKSNDTELDPAPSGNDGGTF